MIIQVEPEPPKEGSIWLKNDRPITIRCLIDILGTQILDMPITIAVGDGYNSLELEKPHSCSFKLRGKDKRLWLHVITSKRLVTRTKKRRTKWEMIEARAAKAARDVES
jgi:hypothetical protein